ncbi:hypothetical protein OF83DRAFT_60276 [Amylostereum chailletii]|nr:hypothetical protein OF83DRAFT_60276 [Amylostereum chailletii]
MALHVSARRDTGVSTRNYIAAMQSTTEESGHVEGKLFKVHRHFFVEHSTVFRDMFALPVPPASSSAPSEIEGDSDEHPIRLSGTTIVEFESLLKVFYRSLHSDFTLSYSEWLSVLAIAHRFELHNVRARAVKKLRSPPTAAEALTLLAAAVRYGVNISEIPEALRKVIRREAALTLEEMDTLSLAILAQIARAREKWIRNKDAYQCTHCQRSLQPNRFRCNYCAIATTNPSGEVNNDALLKTILKDVWNI